MEYTVINIEYDTKDSLRQSLNEFAKAGWRVVCSTPIGLILEKQDKSKTGFIPANKAITFTGMDGL